MIKRLQKLKAKRGFTMIELIVVIAIIGIMATTVLVGLDTRSSKVKEANNAASDFYSAIQTEFTNFQMFDGPLTMSLDKAYKSGISSIGANSDNGGVKYYPAAGGNYPFAGETAVGETHLDGLPKKAALYVEFYTYGGTVRRVNYANDITTLFGMTGTGNANAQLCLVLKQEMQERISYRDGYYYAKITYEPPTGINLSRYDYRSNSVRVEWAAYTSKQMTTNEDTYRFKSQNLLRGGSLCGVQTTSACPTLGTTGTSIMDF